jgi:hypothetical protein
MATLIEENRRLHKELAIAREEWLNNIYRAKE